MALDEKTKHEYFTHRDFLGGGSISKTKMMRKIELIITLLKCFY